MQLTELQLIDSLSISAQHLTVCRHLPPPRILLHQFEEMAAASKGTSRCLWTCRGSISQIVSIQAFLRCGKCMSKVDPVFSSAKTAEYGSVPLRCAKCLHDIVNTVWQMSLYFDDGTGECRLSVDGEMVFELLSALLANGCVSDTRRMVESALHQIGAVRAYAFEKKNVAAADRAMSLEEPFEEEMRCLLLLRSAEEFSGEETVTKENLALKCKAVMLELIKSFRAPSDVTLQVRQIPASAQVAFGSMQFDNLESRKIKVQRSGTPAWSVETVEPVVMFQPKLRLELVSFSIFLEEKMHSACWEMLKA